jgi:RimJ/RimL family protein N-acetyltransferase
METADADYYIAKLFKILHSNMSLIAPSGETYEDDYKLWSQNIISALKKENRNIVLIFGNDELVGFFMYYVTDRLWMMEEIQIHDDWQGKYNIFRLLYEYLFSILPDNIQTVEAYAYKKNVKSNAILKHLGLTIIDENKNNFHYQGRFIAIQNWYNHQNEYIL